MPTEPAPRAHETSVRVRSYELDSFGHVNHAVFLSYLEYARFQTFADAGFPVSALIEKGWGVFVVRIEADYLAEARLDDELTVRTCAAEARRSSVLLQQDVLRDGEAIFRGMVTIVWVGPDRRPVRVPAEVRTAFGLQA